LSISSMAHFVSWSSIISGFSAMSISRSSLYLLRSLSLLIFQEMIFMRRGGGEEVGNYQILDVSNLSWPWSVLSPVWACWWISTLFSFHPSKVYADLSTYFSRFLSLH
jgi:hypothetical protein